ncbi:MAG TPA: branched-chain amino acid transaminase [Thermoanaerobaculia bacterium]|nr:branched-chain amino acid transaminase [Thermoanaerobaculia bacterium]
MNGRLVDFEKATVHVLAHALHYGSGVFEGIRCYTTPEGPAVFRLDDHLRRLERSAKTYRMPIPYDREELTEAILELIAANDLDACYIRPLVFRGFGHMGVNPLPAPVETVVAVWNWGKYLGEEGQRVGVDVCVSSWRRGSPGTIPMLAKATANYYAAQLIRMEAVINGYSEGLALDSHGNLSEGSGENVFLVQDGTLLTPPLSASILPGITRHTVITLAAEMGIPVREEVIPRGALHICDEMFLTGTAVEITPIRSIDRIPVGTGEVGPITHRIQSEFFAVVTGQIPDRYGWLTHVPARVAQVAT